MTPNHINVFGDINSPKPYKSIVFGDINSPKPYKSIVFGGINSRRSTDSPDDPRPSSPRQRRPRLEVAFGLAKTRLS